ncbi:MAG TPA: chemotaxis protein CheW [Waterburya sp.]|jgi:positive phototaxis protein PixI
MFTPQFVSSTATTLDLLTLDPLPLETGERLLRFPLGLQDSALLPLEQITEIIRVNVAEILPVPEMPSCVLGICNWRGTMLWLIDLNHLLSYPPLSQQERGLATPMAMVVQANDQTVGLVVQRVNDIELHELQQLQPAAPGLFSPNLLPFVLGALPGGKGTVLDVTAIKQCPLWQVHRTRVS